jgi:hypothetical protein
MKEKDWGYFLGFFQNFLEAKIGRVGTTICGNQHMLIQHDLA